MKNYRIYTGLGGASEAVKQGWSWPAFFFGPLWALYKKLWLVGFGFLSLFLAFGIMEAYVELEKGAQVADQLRILDSLISLAISVTFGLKGNRWRESNLETHRFQRRDSVAAQNPDEALLRAVLNSRDKDS